LATVGFADTYLNGVLVEPRSLAGVTLERATVRFDEKGNLHVEAPGYKVQVVPPKTTASSPAPNGIVPGRWWVVTEDQGSIGHTVEVLVNGQLVTTSRSGEGDRVFDLGPWLRTGPNTVLVRSVSTTPSGGTLTIFVGAGGSDKGTFAMSRPQVEYGVGARQSGPQQRAFTLNVDR
jgi:hypothetical protein